MFVNPSTRSQVANLLRGVAWVLFAIGALAFLFGDVVLHEVIAGTDFILAIIEGLALAVLFGMLGFVVKEAAERLEEAEVDPNGPKTLGEVLRK